LASRAHRGDYDVQEDFGDEEWTRIRRAPIVAGVAISLADPGFGAERVSAGEQRMLDQVPTALEMA
jgi:hypothetical protein